LSWTSWRRSSTATRSATPNSPPRSPCTRASTAGTWATTGPPTSTSRSWAAHRGPLRPPPCDRWSPSGGPARSVTGPCGGTSSSSILAMATSRAPRSSGDSTSAGARPAAVTASAADPRRSGRRSILAEERAA
jgi:hypothetical protein